ncbi:MAG: DUF3870 domain-containing protein [Synergistetes bacterium]|nr:DUF3870 domain-containing protein [Synergistota bacterium]
MPTLFIAGYAHLPHDITAYQLYKVLGLFLEIDEETGVIEDVEISLTSRLAQRVLKECIKGKSLLTDLDLIKSEICYRYHGEAKKAVIAALKSAHQRFLEARKKFQ